MTDARREPTRVAANAGTRAVERLWRGEAGPSGIGLDLALAPLELVYRVAAGAYHRAFALGWRTPHRLGVPVISVGNLAVGGTGKTPVTRWLVGELLRRGARPAVLHGGYAPDEPALHRSWHPAVPVIVGRDRVAGGERAVAAGAGVVVLDDGFQHRRLARDLDVALVAAEDWTPRPRLLPRGPWRESPRALARAHVVLVTRRTASRAEAERVANAAHAFAPDAIRAQVRLEPAGWRAAHGGAEGHPEGPVVAVAGVARPDAFLANAAAAGARIGSALVFRDHHRYDGADVRRIREAAADRAIVTTAKDAVKLAPLAPELDMWILEQKVCVEAGAGALARRLDELVA